MTSTRSEASDAPFATTIGLSALARMIYNGVDREPLVSSLISRATTNPVDAAAMMDLSMMVQLTGDRAHGLEIQSQALDVTRVYRCVHGSGEGLRVLALFAAGDFMANTPLDFLLDGSDVTVYYAYVPAGMAFPVDLPSHDVAFLGVAESASNRNLLNELIDVALEWSRPMVNCDPRGILQMARDRLWERFQLSRDVVAPRNVRTSRAALSAVAAVTTSLDELLPGGQFPIIVRPLDSHAGNGLAKIDDAPALSAYLDVADDEVFYIAPFVDYRSSDGQFRKYRIVFVSGHAYVAHLAISDDWMVHYLNAGMHESAAKRDEEAVCMARFDEDFGVRHSLALAEISALIGLDYFAIDCAEMRDGRLLLFEAGTGMIVHGMDSDDLFPYKQIQMRKIFRAFLDMLRTAGQVGAIFRTGEHSDL